MRSIGADYRTPSKDEHCSFHRVVAAMAITLESLCASGACEAAAVLRTSVLRLEGRMVMAVDLEAPSLDAKS